MAEVETEESAKVKPPKPEPPNEVRLASMLWRTVAGLWFVHGMMSTVVFARNEKGRFVEELTKQLTTANNGVPPSARTVEIVFYAAGIGGTIFFQMVLCGLFVWLVSLMRRGKNWARIILEVFGMFQIFQAAGLLLGQAELHTVFDFVMGCVAIVSGCVAGYAIYLDLQKESSHYFHPRPPVH